MQETPSTEPNRAEAKPATDAQALAALELGAVEWGLWRAHPVTKVFLQLLADQEVNSRSTIMALWEAGALKGQESEYNRGFVHALMGLRNLAHDAIGGFYRDSHPHLAKTSDDPDPQPDAP